MPTPRSGSYSATSPKALRFCDEFLVDLNAAAAARRAGYAARSASVTGAQLMKLPEIRERIKALMDARAEATRVQAYKVLEELAVVAFSSVDHFAIDDAGHVTLVEGAPDSAIRAVASIKRKRRERTTDDETVVEFETELRLWDKNSALTNALKHLGMLTDKHEHSFPNGAGVLAVPVPVGDAQWGAMAAAQQAALTATPPAIAARMNGNGTHP